MTPHRAEPVPQALTPLAATPLQASAMWKQTVLVERADGREECFAIGPDGHLWCYELAAQGAAAGRLISTGLAPRVFAVGDDGRGRLVVIGAGEQGIQWVVENGLGAATRWGPPQRLPLRGLSATARVERVVTLAEHGNLFVAFLMRYLEGPHDQRLRLLDGVWAGGTLVLRHVPVVPGGPDDLWRDHFEQLLH